MSYQEAKAKYESWKAEKAEIRVGDEIIPLETPYITMVVTQVRKNECDDDKWVDVIASDGKVYRYLKTGIKKTGRHFDTVERLLEEMRSKSHEHH